MHLPLNWQMYSPIFINGFLELKERHLGPEPRLEGWKKCRKTLVKAVGLEDAHLIRVDVGGERVATDT
jgi:hypothetical protein